MIPWMRLLVRVHILPLLKPQPKGDMVLKWTPCYTLPPLHDPVDYDLLTEAQQSVIGHLQSVVERHARGPRSTEPPALRFRRPLPQLFAATAACSRREAGSRDDVVAAQDLPRPRHSVDLTQTHTRRTRV